MFYQDARPEIGGLHEEFDLRELISAVYVGPRAEDFIFETVSAVMEKFGLDKLLNRSTLLNSPKKRMVVPSEAKVLGRVRH